MNISKSPKSFATALLALTLSLPMALTIASASGGPSLQPQAQTVSALERGYRTGYSDGFQAGYADAAESAARDYSRKEDYRRGDRAYAAAYGSLDDYRDGYRQGFQVGYNAGFDHRPFDSTVPTGLARTEGASGNQSVDQQSEPADNAATANTGDPQASGAQNAPASAAPTANTNPNLGPVFIPPDTMMRVELLTNLSTDASQRGDRFQARVLEPREFEGAILDGRVTSVKRAGKVKGRSELQLSIEQIRLTDNRWANLSGQVVEVLPDGSRDNGGVVEVDPEGGVRGRDKTKDDVATVGASTGVGAIIGAIAGGGKGAAIGAAIGGAIGTGRVLTSSGGDIRLTRGQQLRIRTANETRIQ